MVSGRASGQDAAVDFAQARTVFLSAPEGERLPPRVPDTPGRRLRDAAEPIATIYIWGRPVHERLAALGLNFLTGYVWTRTAPMGEPSAPVVAAAFAVFEPGLVAGLWGAVPLGVCGPGLAAGLYEEARRTAARDAILAAREEGAVASLRELLPDADVAEAVRLLRRATDLAATDVAGRPLFAGLVSLPWPADPLGRLWHATNLLREYRGDVHVAANVAAGLTGLQMNLMTEYW